MKRALLVLLAAFAGIVASEAIYRFRVFRGADEVVRRDLAQDPVAAREFDLLRAQFPDEQSFTQALSASGLSSAALRQEVAKHVAEREKIEKQISPQLGVSTDEVRQYYDAHPDQFALPQRYRASHIFLAAPDGAPAEVIAAKQSVIQGIAVRLLAGENFSDLAAELSEDEATKSRGGDLGYFSDHRIPPEFIAEIEKLHPGETSPPIRSHLGFHVVRLSEVKPTQEMRFEEVQVEIARQLTNAKRAASVARLAQQANTR